MQLSTFFNSHSPTLGQRTPSACRALCLKRGLSSHFLSGHLRALAAPKTSMGMFGLEGSKEAELVRLVLNLGKRCVWKTRTAHHMASLPLVLLDQCLPLQNSCDPSQQEKNWLSGRTSCVFLQESVRICLKTALLLYTPPTFFSLTLPSQLLL